MAKKACKTGAKSGKWIKIGEVGVDSGQLMVVDPTYAEDTLDYDRDVDKQYQALPFPKGFKGLAVIFDSGIGDGMYPVYARFEVDPAFGKRIAEVKIKML